LKRFFPAEINRRKQRSSLLTQALSARKFFARRRGRTG
jgi:hypothetical protein